MITKYFMTLLSIPDFYSIQVILKMWEIANCRCCIFFHRNSHFVCSNHLLFPFCIQSWTLYALSPCLLQTWEYTWVEFFSPACGRIVCTFGTLRTFTLAWQPFSGLLSHFIVQKGSRGEKIPFFSPPPSAMGNLSVKWGRLQRRDRVWGGVFTLFAPRQSLQCRLVPDRSARLFHKPHGGNETYMPPIKETERVSEVCVQGL